MAFAIELLPDELTNAAICRFRDAVANALPERHAAVTRAVEPHVTLAVCESINLLAFRSALSDYAAAHKAKPVAFASAGWFVTPGVIFLAPVVTPDLLTVHVDLHKRFPQLPVGEVSALYKPGRWVPHCALAENLPAEQVTVAMRAIAKLVAGGEALPIVGQLDVVRVVEFPPPRERCRSVLGGKRPSPAPPPASAERRAE